MTGPVSTASPLFVWTSYLGASSVVPGRVLRRGFRLDIVSGLGINQPISDHGMPRDTPQPLATVVTLSVVAATAPPQRSRRRNKITFRVRNFCNHHSFHWCYSGSNCKVRLGFHGYTAAVVPLTSKKIFVIPKKRTYVDLSGELTRSQDSRRKKRRVCVCFFSFFFSRLKTKRYNIETKQKSFRPAVSPVNKKKIELKIPSKT